jgi:hypothetical protein
VNDQSHFDIEKRSEAAGGLTKLGAADIVELTWPLSPAKPSIVTTRLTST